MALAIHPQSVLGRLAPRQDSRVRRQRERCARGGALVRARAKRVPVAASLSKAGVAPSGAPYAPSRSARVVSRVTSNTFGRAAALDATARTVKRKHVRRPPGRKFDGFMESGAAP